LHLRVHGPDCVPLTPDVLERLFTPAALTDARRDRLTTWSRVLATCGNVVVGIATYRRTDQELRVADFGVDDRCACSIGEIVGALVHALELACLAGGCQRIMLIPPMAAISALRKRGYTVISEGCAGSWMERSFS
jgi:hypothetical protein